MKAFYLLIALFLCSTLSAQTVSTYPELPYTTFYNFDVSGDNIIALGRCEQVWTSTDGGITWKYDEVNAISNYNVKLIPGNPNQALISQFRGFVLYDFDQGVINDFADVPALVDNANNELQVHDGKAYTFNSSGMYAADLSTYNWEQIWQDTAESDVVVKSSLTDSYIYMGMLKGRVLRYEFATGEVEFVRDYTDRIGALEMVNDNLGYIITNASQKILKTTDGGFTYEELEGMPERINPKAYGEDILLSLNTNRIYKSTDGGASSTYFETANTPSLTYADNGMFTDDGTFYMVGEASMFAKSTDFGETFTVMNPMRRTDFGGIDMVENGTGYVCGAYGSIIKTEDSGATWDLLQTDIPEEYLEDLVILPNGNYIVAGNDALYTMQGSTILNKVEQSTYALLYNDGYTLAALYNGDSYAIHRSTDNGMTWTEVLDGLGFTSSITQGNNGNIYIDGEGTTAHVSTDGGITWSIKEINTESRGLIHVVDDTFLSLNGNKLDKTTDDGATWENIIGIYAIQNVRILSPDHYIFTSRTQNETSLYETLDGGGKWNEIFQNCSPTQDVYVTDDLKVYMAQEGGHINVAQLTDIFIATKDSEISNLEVLFPNPIMAGSNFQSSSQWTTLELYDVTGKLVNRYNKYQTEVPTELLDKGYYIAKFTTDQGAGVQKLIVY